MFKCRLFIFTPVTLQQLLLAFKKGSPLVSYCFHVVVIYNNNKKSTKILSRLIATGFTILSFVVPWGWGGGILFVRSRLVDLVRVF